MAPTTTWPRGPAARKRCWPRPSRSSASLRGGPLIVLASASPRRALILRSLGVRFEVRVSHVDETLAPGEDAEQAARRLAHAKAAAIARNDPRPVLAADTLVACDGPILGKPSSP